MSWIAVGVTIAAAATKAIGSVQEGNARAAQLNQQGAQADYNAQLAEQNAVVAWQQGTAQEAAVRRRAGGILGEQAAALAESGFDITSGSALAIAKQSATNAELDSLSTIYNTDLRARGFKVAAEQDRYQASLSHAGAGAARTAGYWGAATGIVNSAASYYGGMGARSGGGSTFGSAPGGYTASGYPEGGG